MKALFMSILLLLSLNSYAQFRNTTWGMRIETVKRIESAKLEYEGRNSLHYSFHVDDLICRLEYTFNAKNALIAISYNFKHQAEYVKLKEPFLKRITSQIEEKYGAATANPTSSIYLWDLKDFSIKAMDDASGGIKVIYTPPAPSLKDIL